MSVGYLSFGVRCPAFRYFCWLAFPPCRAATQGKLPKTLRRILVFCVFALSCAATQGNQPKTLRRVLWVRCSAGSRAATQGKLPKTLRRVLVFCVFALSRAATQGKLPETLRRVLQCNSLDCEKLSTI